MPNSNFGRVIWQIICSKTPFKGLAPISEVKEVLIHKDLILSNVTCTKNVLKMANSADPDETPLLFLQVVECSHFGSGVFFCINKCTNHIPTIVYIGF